MAKKVLVTGANGFIGRYVVKALLDRGANVIAADFGYDGVDERAQRCSVPIFDDNKNIYKEIGAPDACIHMAWRDGFVHNSDAHIMDLPNHYSFIKNMLEGGLPQIAVMGTMHEVGYWEGAIDSKTPTNPSSMYGISKNALREASRLLATENNAIWQWLRAYYIYSSDTKGSSIFAKIAKAAQEGKKTFPFTTGKNLYDFITVEELADQIAACLLQTEVTGVINCCTGQPISLAEKIEQYIKDNNFDIKLEYGAYPDRPYDSPGEWGDPRKINMVMKKDFVVHKPVK